MTERIFEYFLNPPARLKFWGRAMSAIGLALIVAGVYLSAGIKAIGLLLATGKAREIPTTLAEAYPSLPTWFRPEGPLGFVLAGLVLVSGLYAIHFARRIERLG